MKCGVVRSLATLPTKADNRLIPVLSRESISSTVCVTELLLPTSLNPPPFAMFPRARPRQSLLALAACIFLTLIGFELSKLRAWRRAPILAGTLNKPGTLQQELESLQAKPPAQDASQATRKFNSGVPEAANYKYTKTIVLGKKQEDDTAWLNEELPKDVIKAVYLVDDALAPLRPPKNKGNEAMVYLTYIIDHYANLSDITIFMHHHRWAWHNSDLLDNDSAMVVKHLIPQRVIRQGYVNLRCQWYPGCPTWLNTTTTTVDREKEEEVLVKDSWSSLFPADPLPASLAQPCCSQFALSRDRIRAVPLAEYERLRTWLLSTRLKDSLSGRLFEYLWQFLWTGSSVSCPSQHACHCDLFGACFASDGAFQKWFESRFRLRRDESALLGWDDETGGAQGKAVVPEDRYKELKERVNARWIGLLQQREEAMRNGKDVRVRAKIAGRELDRGDG
jgi:hypothetical protein